MGVRMRALALSLVAACSGGPATEGSTSDGDAGGLANDATDAAAAPTTPLPIDPSSAVDGGPWSAPVTPTGCPFDHVDLPTTLRPPIRVGQTRNGTLVVLDNGGPGMPGVFVSENGVLRRHLCQGATTTTDASDNPNPPRPVTSYIVDNGASQFAVRVEEGTLKSIGFGSNEDPLVALPPETVASLPVVEPETITDVMNVEPQPSGPPLVLFKTTNVKTLEQTFRGFYAPSGTTLQEYPTVLFSEVAELTIDGKARKFALPNAYEIPSASVLTGLAFLCR